MPYCHSALAKPTPPNHPNSALCTKKELDELEQKGIVTRVDEPTDWVNSLVCVTKSNGALRLCIDPKDLNQAIKRPHHCTPTLDEFLSKLNGAKYFSIVNACSGYWNMQLDRKSSLYTTFNSPHGRYRFLRLPFGLICKKHLSTAPSRIVRMMLRIQKYDVEIKYVPGKEIPLANALSRISPCPGDTIEGLNVSVHELQLHLNASPTRIDQIKKGTA